jgi:2-polyprenyl-6-methoxyphenol hydroxylase-like FAD-dependent oxidoreductase
VTESTTRVAGAPVLVAGGGPVGVVTALLLARWGVPSVVLEAADRRDDVGSKAICFQRDVLDVFDRVGCAGPMVAEGVTWTIGRTFYREHELVTTTFPEPGRSAFPPWINISQASVERYLAGRVAAQPLVDVRWGHRVVGLEQDSPGVRVEVEAAGRREVVAGSHLVGADGAHGAVRDLVGIDFPGRSYADRFLICDIRADLPFPKERRFHFDPRWNPGRQVLVHQCPDSTWRIDWQVPADYDLARERANGDLDARIRRIVGDRPYEIVWLTVYRFHERLAASFRAGRVFLAGDAAHLYAPFGARGLNSGVQDAENLAWKLAFVRRGWSTGAAAETLLDSYDSERRAAAAENLRVTSSTMDFLVPQSEAQWAWRRDVLERAVSDPAARRQIDSGKLAEPYWYLDSPLTTPAAEAGDFPTAPGALRPPVPGVLCPDGPCAGGGTARLRGLFGTGFVVLTASSARLPAAMSCVDGLTAPVRVYALADLDTDGVLARALHAGPDSVHVVRPDGHLAAVLPRFEADALLTALHRARGATAAAGPADLGRIHAAGRPGTWR